MALPTPTIYSPAETVNKASDNILNNDIAPVTAQFITNTIDNVRNFDFAQTLSILKITAISTTIIFIILLVWIFSKIQRLIKMRAQQFAESLSPPKVATSAYDKRWEEIKRHVNSFNIAEWKLAVIESDKLVDNALKAGGFLGETMGERLTLIKPEQIREIGNLWEAHKLRNLLVHDPEYEMSHNQAIASVEVFERILRELGGLQ